MGEIADMMLEGIICKICGVFIDDNKANGHPRMCESCQKEEK